MGITQMSVSNGVALHTPEELIAIHRAAGDAVVRLTRWADNFPGPGVRFADLTPVFADAEGFGAVLDALVACAPDADTIAAVDARGFLLGAGAAAKMGAGVVAVRKVGKLPPPVLSFVQPRVRILDSRDPRKRLRSHRAECSGDRRRSGYRRDTRGGCTVG